jgi:hypothetical protein
LVVDQVSVAVPPIITEVGLAAMVTVGGGGALIIGATALLLPPPPPPHAVNRMPSSSEVATGRNEFQRTCFICCCLLMTVRNTPRKIHTRAK